MGTLYSAAAASWTPTAKADNAITITGGAHSLQSQTANGDFCKILEVFIGGEATSSTVDAFCLRRGKTTAASGITNIAPAPLNGISANAAVFKSYTAATTMPIPTDAIPHLLSLSLNVFGGIIRWVAAPGEEVWFYGTTAAQGDMILSTTSGTGVVSTHYVVEEL